MLANDLMDAVRRADDENRAALADIVGFVYMEMPVGCHGSRRAFQEWIASFNTTNREK